MKFLFNTFLLAALATLSACNITVSESDDETNTFTISGTLSGLAGDSVVLQQNGGNNLTLSADGSFVFSISIESGLSFNVTVLTQPSGPAQTCSVINGSATVTNSNITNIEVTCITDSPGADNTPPDITLVGASTVSLIQGQSYSEQGASADDAVDGSVGVIITGAVDSDTIGSYDITYTATDAAANSSNSVRTVNVISKPNIVAFAWAHDPTSASYTPSETYSYNSSGGAIVATQSSTGVYRMQFTDLALSSGNVLVTAYNNLATCNVGSWSGDSVNVLCYDASGVAASSSYTVSVTLNETSLANVVGYAWANNASSASYTPSTTYSYNASGGEIVAQQSATGIYSMRFVGLDLSTGNVQASAYNSSANCRVSNWTGDTANVSCFDSAGALVDSRYTVSVTLNQVSTAETVAYVWANDPDNASYTPSEFYSYNSSGDEITITQSNTGIYAVSFSGLSLASGNVQVSAYNSNAICNVTSWGGSVVNAACYDSNGAAVNSRFTVGVTKTKTETPNIAAYAWANNSTSASYTPSASYSYNSSGGAIVATRSSTGVYNMEFADLDLGSGNVQVTAYNSSASCHVASWSASSANVVCFDSDGVFVDTLYSLSVTLNEPSEANTVAYAWAHDSSAASYTPSAAYSYNSAGGAMVAAQSATGVYSMQFVDLVMSTGNVQVSAYNSDATCNVMNWGGGTVDVSCFDSDGSAVNSSYVIDVTLNQASAAKTVAYVWANGPTADSYEPSSLYSYNLNNSVIAATRSDFGVYSMSFTGLDLNGGSVQVVAYGSSGAKCTVSSWSSSTVNVRCFDASGQPTDSRYSMSLMTH